MPSPGTSGQDPSYNTSLVSRIRTQGSSMGRFKGAGGTFLAFPSSQSRRGAAAGAGAVRVDASDSFVLFLHSGLFKERELATQRQTNPFVALFCFLFCFSFPILLPRTFLKENKKSGSIHPAQEEPTALGSPTTPLLISLHSNRHPSHLLWGPRPSVAQCFFSF